MAVIKAVNSRSSLGNALRYITKVSKTEECLISAVNCDPKNAFIEMMATKRAWGKTDGRQYKHFIQSFPPEEKITAMQANRIVEELIARCPLFEGYEVAFATHTDRTHIHTHIIVNSVSFVDGRKIHQSRRDLQDLKDLSDEILREHGLSICEKNPSVVSSFRNGLYQVLEKDAAGEGRSWMADVLRAVAASLSEAQDRESFIQAMRSRGIETSWTNRKHIVFTDADGHKVRDTRLARTFKIAISKEDLTDEFHRLCTESPGSGRQKQPQAADRRSSRSADGRYARKHADAGKSAAERELGKLRGQLAELSGSDSGQSGGSAVKSEHTSESASDGKRYAEQSARSARRTVHTDFDPER